MQAPWNNIIIGNYWNFYRTKLFGGKRIWTRAYLASTGFEPRLISMHQLDLNLDLFGINWSLTQAYLTIMLDLNPDFIGVYSISECTLHNTIWSRMRAGNIDMNMEGKQS